MAKRPGGPTPERRRSSLSQDRKQPRFEHVRHRRRANRLVLRLLRPGVLRPAGKELWKHEQPAAATGAGFGSGVSPIIADGLVVLVRDEFEDPQNSLPWISSHGGRCGNGSAQQSSMSFSTPIVWDTPSGKQVVVAGHARMIGYDLNTGEETLVGRGVPSACCASPVTAEGMLLFAGGMTTGPDEKEPQSPSAQYDKLLKEHDKDGDGKISREEGEKGFQGFFDNQDANKDGFVEREEFEMIMKFMLEGKNTAFALKPGGSGDVTESHVLWRKTKGLPYIATAIAYGGQLVMVRDGGVVTAYDAKTGDEIVKAQSPPPARTMPPPSRPAETSTSRRCETAP